MDGPLVELTEVITIQSHFDTNRLQLRLEKNIYCTAPHCLIQLRLEKKTFTVQL